MSRKMLTQLAAKAQEGFVHFHESAQNSPRVIIVRELFEHAARWLLDHPKAMSSCQQQDKHADAGCDPHVAPGSKMITACRPKSSQVLVRLLFDV